LTQRIPGFVFPRRDRSGSDNRLSTLRDVVEIIAILAAGIWAFYVFVYENNFKPSHAPPSINVTASIDKLGTHNGLIAVRIRVELRNSSSVSVRILANAVTVFGQHVALVSTKRLPLQTADEIELRAFYRASQSVPVYSSARLGKAVDPSSRFDSELDPGDSSSEEDVFYIPDKAFDLLTLRVNVLYAREGTKGLVVHIVATPQRGPDFLYDKNDVRINQFVVEPLDSLDLGTRH
jgi:hypothetical protein